MYQTLISVEQLVALQRSADQPVLFDCRFILMVPAQGQQYLSGQQQYQQGHIAEAHYLHLDEDLSSVIGFRTGRHPLPDFDALAQTLARAGVTAARQVVVYDDCGGAMAGRAWWLMKLMGLTEVAVLDGGFPAWTEAEQLVTDALPEVAEGASLAYTINAQMMRDAAEVQALASDWQLVDARTPERYRGEQEPIDPVAGHIPGAINRPLQQNLNEQGLFKTPEQLRSEWLTFLNGTTPEQVVHYCGSGVTACHNMLAMEHAGLTGSKVYPGSWSEWIKDIERPVVRGEE